MIEVTRDLTSMDGTLTEAARQNAATRVELMDSIRLGLAQAKQGLGRLPDDVFSDMESGPVCSTE